MHLRRWEPLDELLCLRESMIHQSIQFPRRAGRTLRPAPWRPAVEVHEEDGRVIFFAALPRIDPKSLEVTVSGDIVTIKALAGASPDRGPLSYYDRRMVYGSYPLPAPVQAALATATFRNGIFKVRIPRAEEPEARTVKVEVAA